VGAAGPDDALVEPLFEHELLRLDAVLFGIEFEVEVVQQPHDRPELLAAGIVLLREPAQHARHDARMPDVEVLGVVLFENSLRLFQIRNLSHWLYPSVDVVVIENQAELVRPVHPLDLDLPAQRLRP